MVNFAWQPLAGLIYLQAKYSK